MNEIDRFLAGDRIRYVDEHQPQKADTPRAICDDLCEQFSRDFRDTFMEPCPNPGVDTSSFEDRIRALIDAAVTKESQTRRSGAE